MLCCLLSVSHASELPLLVGNRVPAADVELDFANTWLDFYINFINDMTPGGTASSLPPRLLAHMYPSRMASADIG